MGIIISFPARERTIRNDSLPSEPATVVILPVIRIERTPDEPSGGLESSAGNGRKRRRRASRS
jgi:hypothetical protein